MEDVVSSVYVVTISELPYAVLEPHAPPVTVTGKPRTVRSVLAPNFTCRFLLSVRHPLLTAEYVGIFLYKSPPVEVTVRCSRSFKF